MMSAPIAGTNSATADVAVTAVRTGAKSHSVAAIVTATSETRIKAALLSPGSMVCFWTRKSVACPPTRISASPTSSTASANTPYTSGPRSRAITTTLASARTLWATCAVKTHAD